MATLLDLTTNAKLIVRTWKNWKGSPKVRWSNTWEVYVEGDVAIGELDTLALALREWERAFTLPAVRYEYATVSTWVPDSKPYNPETFRRIPYDNVEGLMGGTIEVNGALPLSDVLWFDRVPLVGNAGKLFLRGSLHKGNVASPNGYWIVDLAAYEGPIADAQGNLMPYLGGGSSDLCLALIGTGQSVRQVLSMQIHGAADVPTEHKWFNRS